MATDWLFNEQKNIILKNLLNFFIGTVTIHNNLSKILIKN